MAFVCYVVWLRAPLLSAVLCVLTCIVYWYLRKFRAQALKLLYLRKFDTSSTITINDRIASAMLPSNFHVISIHDISGKSNPVRQRHGVASFIAFLMTIGVIWAVGLDSSDRTSTVLKIVGLMGLFNFLILALIKRLERRSADYSITNDNTLEAAIDEISRAGSSGKKLKRITILETTEPLWRSAVKRLAHLSDVILVDLSQSGPGLLWEMEMVLSEHEPKVVLVIDGNNTSVNMKTSEALEALLDGKSILASRNSLLRIWF